MPKEKRFPTSFMFGEDRVQIEYRPPAPEEFEALQRRYKDNEYALRVTLMMLTHWNVEDDGKMTPITYETLCQLPYDFINALNAAMLADFQKRIAEQERGGGFHA